MIKRLLLLLESPTCARHQWHLKRFFTKFIYRFFLYRRCRKEYFLIFEERSKDTFDRLFKGKASLTEEGKLCLERIDELYFSLTEIKKVINICTDHEIAIFHLGVYNSPNPTMCCDDVGVCEEFYCSFECWKETYNRCNSYFLKYLSDNTNHLNSFTYHPYLIDEDDWLNFKRRYYKARKKQAKSRHKVKKKTK